MSENKILEKLQAIRDNESFDAGYIDILIESNSNKESSEETARRVINEIKNRYDKNKEN